MLKRVSRRVTYEAPAQTTSVAPTVVHTGTGSQERIARQRTRSLELVQTITRLDTATDPTVYRQLIEWVKADYDARQGGIPIGLFAKCYLGPPFIDHRMTLMGNICEHYKPSDVPPHPYGQARGLVRSGAYEFIEFYSDGSMVAIMPDGRSVEVAANQSSTLRPGNTSGR
ncbi:MAG: hypothetical protein WBA38_16600 [Gordonia sp. (in: high G+C Gram-positive bacteria)]|uniref:hypothetical protein n=1 Tax=Gordonia sp. (in: high G+C Gram-positive bacteria) TaxID=84139 RepID=UPI003C742961